MFGSCSVQVSVSMGFNFRYVLFCLFFLLKLSSAPREERAMKLNVALFFYFLLHRCSFFHWLLFFSVLLSVSADCFSGNSKMLRNILDKTSDAAKPVIQSNFKIIFYQSFVTPPEVFGENMWMC